LRPSTAFNGTELSRFHFGTLKKGKGSNIKYLPYAFTEQGVAIKKKYGFLADREN
jgi:hypothetical protein